MRKKNERERTRELKEIEEIGGRYCSLSREWRQTDRRSKFLYKSQSCFGRFWLLLLHW